MSSVFRTKGGIWFRPDTWRKGPGSELPTTAAAANGRNGTAVLDHKIELPMELQLIRAHLGPMGSPLLPAQLCVLGEAVGPSAKLFSTLFPGAINGSLACALLGDESRPTRHAVVAITQVLREVQDKRLSERGEMNSRQIQRSIGIEESRRAAFFAGQPFRDPSAEASFTSRINHLRRLLRPAIIVENQAPGSLPEVVGQAAGGLLAVYWDSALNRLIDQLKQGEADFELLNGSWEGNTPVATFLKNPKTSALVPTAVSCLCECSSTTLGRLFCSSRPHVQEFVNRLIVCRLPSGGAENLLWRMPESWQGLVERLIASGDPFAPRAFSLSRGATAYLEHYARELSHPNFQPGRWLLCAPRLAAKICLILRLCSTETGSEISEALMHSAIELAKNFIGLTSEAMRSCVGQQEAYTLSREAARMLEKVQRHEPIRPRLLFRKYDDARKELHQPVLDYLLRQGQVILREDGLLASAQPPTGGAQ